MSKYSIAQTTVGRTFQHLILKFIAEEIKCRHPYTSADWVCKTFAWCIKAPATETINVLSELDTFTLEKLRHGPHY